MIARKLFTPEQLNGRTSLRFADHTLMTEVILKPYASPEHRPGPGILTMINGAGRFRINDETLTLDNTRYFFIDQDTRLSIRLTQPDSTPLFLFFRTDTVREALAKQNAELCWLERQHPMNDGLKERLDWLTSLGNSSSSFSALKADAMIRDILQELIRQTLAAVAIAGNLPVSRNATRIELFKRLAQTREWIDANYSSPVSLAGMAEKAQLNCQHFLRMFRDCFGATPHQYLIDIRLAAAQRLLTETNEPVSSICRMTGFESNPSFSSLFRSRFGASPKTWRQNPPPDAQPFPVTASTP
jgi:AraC family transcriptional regulator